MTYEEIAAHYGVTLDALAWPERRVTRLGLRQFLISYYMYRQLNVLGRNPEYWELIWRANVWAQNEALVQWHRRIPRRYSDGDRTRVAWFIQDSWSKAEPAIKEQALRWAANRSL